MSVLNTNDDIINQSGKILFETWSCTWLSIRCGLYVMHSIRPICKRAASFDALLQSHGGKKNSWTWICEKWHAKKKIIAFNYFYLILNT